MQMRAIEVVSSDGNGLDVKSVAFDSNSGTLTIMIDGQVTTQQPVGFSIGERN